MTATVHRLPAASKRIGSTPSMAKGVSAERAVKLLVRHARLVCLEAAHGDPKRLRDLFTQQGEILLLAGLQLMTEGGEG